MANPHGFTVATMPEANARASGASSWITTPPSQVDAQLLGEEAPQLVGGELAGMALHHLPIGIEEHRGREHDRLERREHGSVLVLRGRVGDARPVDHLE